MRGVEKFSYISHLRYPSLMLSWCSGLEKGPGSRIYWIDIGCLSLGIVIIGRCIA